MHLQASTTTRGEGSLAFSSDKCAPYRVEWRPDLTTRWLLITHCGGHEQAREAAKATRKKYNGQVRIVTQHVIEVEGLGG